MNKDARRAEGNNTVLSTKRPKLKKLDFAPMREKDIHFIGVL